jgi:hypothetical protein
MRAAANDSAIAKTATTAAPYHRMVIAFCEFKSETQFSDVCREQRGVW